MRNHSKLHKLQAHGDAGASDIAALLPEGSHKPDELTDILLGIAVQSKVADGE
jgi:hypothetical protein